MPRSYSSNDFLYARLLDRRRKTSGLVMILYIVGSVVAGILGVALTRKGKLRYAMDWAMVQLNYNIIAIKNLFADQVQAKANRTELPKLSGKVAIVTGGSRGIGFEIVRMLMQCDMEVIIACRKTTAGEKAVETIRASGIETGKAKVMELDNASFDSIKKFVEEFNNNYEKLDVLINNAGIMFTPYRETRDGFEEQYGVNYLSHFLLTLLLLPALKKGGTAERYSRIVNVTSCAHLLGDINFDDINHKRYFLTGAAYAQSKLAQLLFTKSLSRLFEEKKLHIRVNGVHPGLVNTDLFDHSHLKYFKCIGRLIFKNPVQGAIPIVFAAVSPQVENKSGVYISNCLEAPTNPLADDESLQDRLFKLSLKQVGLENVI